MIEWWQHVGFVVRPKKRGRDADQIASALGHLEPGETVIYLESGECITVKRHART